MLFHLFVLFFCLIGWMGVGGYKRRRIWGERILRLQVGLIGCSHKLLVSRDCAGKEISEEEGAISL